MSSGKRHSRELRKDFDVSGNGLFSQAEKKNPKETGWLAWPLFFKYSNKIT